MKLKKKLTALFSFLLLSVFLLTGCSPEMTDLATDVLTEVITEMEAETDAEVVELPEIEELPEVVELPENEEVTTEADDPTLDEDGSYTSKEEVAAYIHEYGHLPSNFITKKEAKKLGWVNNEGNLGEVAPGMSIGGDYFGNYEGILPEENGREYHECDIDFDGTYRNAKRIIYSNDGLIYYTEDHYETFELLYGEE